MAAVGCFAGAFFNNPARLASLASTGYSPASDATVVQWTKADALSLNNNDPVATWTATVGVNALQAVGGLQPTFNTSVQNGLPMVTFPNGKYMLAATVTVSQPCTLWIVGRVTDLNQEFFTDGVSGRQIAFTPSSQFGMFAGNTVSGGSQNTNFHVFEFVFNGASSYIRVDNGTKITGDAGANNLSGLYFASQTAQANTGNVQMGELVYKNIATTTEAAEYLYYKNRWGL